jgi:hypothetical protein
MRAVISWVSERRASVDGDNDDSVELGDVGGEAYRDMGAELAFVEAGILLWHEILSNYRV